MMLVVIGGFCIIEEGLGSRYGGLAGRSLGIRGLSDLRFSRVSVLGRFTDCTLGSGGPELLDFDPGT